MRVGATGPAPCKVCRQDTPHEVIAPVTRGQDYLRCRVCGTVWHQPKAKG